MAGEWDVVGEQPLSEWDVIETAPVAPAPKPAPPKREVGDVETALRTVGSSVKPIVRMYGLAMSAVARGIDEVNNLRTGRDDRFYSDAVMAETDDSVAGNTDAYAPKPGEEMGLPGQIAGGIFSAPIEMAGGFGLQRGVDRSADVLQRGGTMPQAVQAGAVSGAANLAANLVPVKVGGAVGRGLEGAIARRIPGAAAPVVGGAIGGGLTGGALGAATDVAVVGAENAALPAGEQFQDLQAELDPGVSGGLGAALGAAAGAKGARGARGLRKPGAAAPAPAEATPGTQGSAGAAGTDLGTLREERAAALPVPIKLTKGQKSRTFEDQRFERETAKDPDHGGKLRENADDQNKKVIENLEAFEDLTGRTETERGNVGRKTVDVLEQKQEAKKAEIRREYDAAREAGELEAPVDTAGLVDYLDRNRSSSTNAGVLSTAEAELVRLGGATKDADGNLVPGQLTLNDMEELRKTIGVGGKKDQTNSHFAGELRTKIDAATEGAGGQLYKAARKRYADYAAEFKNQGVVRDLLALKKNTTDRTVAFDNVVKRIVLSGDPDDLRAVRRSLNDFGEEGKQAFREIQGQAIKHLREQATGNASRDAQGRPIVSDAKYAAALKAMDRDGRLDDLFGKQGAQQLRDVGDLLKDIYTSPPGAVNTSNTASVLIKYLTDAAISGFSTGVPLPLIHGAKAAKDFYQGRKIRKKVGEHLGPDGELPRSDKNPFTVPEEPPPAPRGTPADQADAPSADARLEQINKLKEGASPETAKVLEAQAKKVQREQRAEQVLEKRTKEAEELERTAQATDDPDLRQALLARAAELRPEKIPTGQAREIEPKEPKAPTKPLPVGETLELDVDQVEALKPSKRERELQRLRDDTTDPEVQKDLDRSITAERKRAADRRRGEEYLRLADQAVDTELRTEFEAKAKKFGVQRETIPVPEVREIPATPETTRAVTNLANDAEAEAAWRQVHRFGDLDAKAAKQVAEAITYDPEAVDRAMTQHERSPRVFEREIARIIEEGKKNARKPPDASEGGEGLEPPPGPKGGGTGPKPGTPGSDGPAAPRADRKEPGAAGRQEGPVSEQQIVSPVDRNATPEQKVEQLARMTEENKPIVDQFLKELDAQFGTKSGSNVKAPAAILAKAKRPAILAAKPWHDVEHIRDSFRFKTVLDSIEQLPAIVDKLNSLGVEVVKADVDKVMRPKEFGWRIAAFDLRMPNGQLVEYYLPVRELEAAKKGEGHKLFEEVRNLDLTDPASRAKYEEVAAKSRKLYEDAWNRYLARSGVDESAVLASLDRSLATAGTSRSNPSSSSSALMAGAGERQAPAASRTAENLPGPNTSRTFDDSSSGAKARTSDIAGTSSNGSILKHAPVGRSSVATTERGVDIPVRYRLVDVSQLITSHGDDLRPNAAFPQELQPRDRTRMSSEAQIARIENGIKPELLGESPKASDGAPIIGADGVVESGNARTIAVRRAYASGKALKYRNWLVDNAHRFGMTAKQAESLKQPMLVRETTGDYDRAEFARQANESAVSSMSETETAKADAQRLPDLEGLVAGEDGVINLTQSGEFVREFMRLAVGPNERNALMTSDGRLSQRGVARVRNAVFAKAYGDSEIVAMMTESTDSGVKNIMNGMLRAAPDVARLRELMDAGARPKADFTPDLVEAVRRYAALREKGMTVAQDQAQGDLMADGPPPRVVEMMTQLESNARAPKRVADMLRGLVGEIDGQGDPRQAGMFNEGE